MTHNAKGILRYVLLNILIEEESIKPEGQEAGTISARILSHNIEHYQTRLHIATNYNYQ